MILTGSEIKERVRSGDITISPFDEDALNPNSYNFRLGDYVYIYKNEVLDPKIKQETIKIDIPDEGIILQPNKLYLGYVKETMGSNYFVPIINGRSSTGRLGLFVHITANLIDIGSINNWTLQMHAVQPIKIYRNMRIGQVTFWRTFGDIELYDGKYKGSIGPEPSQIWRDFD